MFAPYSQIAMFATHLFVATSLVLICGCSPGPNSTSLFLAVESDRPEEINRLAALGVDVNSRKNDQSTPLMVAIKLSKKNSFMALLAKGADPNLLDNRGFSVMESAAAKEDSSWLNAAIKHGGNVNLTNAGNPFFPGRTPIFEAIEHRRLENVKVLIAAGADLNHREKSKMFPLLHANEKQAYDIVFALVNAGADYHQKTPAGDSLISWLSNKEETSIPSDEQRQWFREVVGFLKAKGEGLGKR